MDLFAMLKIKVHAEADENVPVELDPVPSLACGAVDDVQVVDVNADLHEEIDKLVGVDLERRAPFDSLLKKAAHVTTLHTQWLALKTKCEGKYVVQGILKDWDVQQEFCWDNLPEQVDVPDGGDEGYSYTTASFKDNFASDLVYEHCLRVQLDYLQTLEAGPNKLDRELGDCALNDGTYSCDSSATFAKIVAWCASFSN